MLCPNVPRVRLGSSRVDLEKVHGGTRVRSKEQDKRITRGMRILYGLDEIVKPSSPQAPDVSTVFLKENISRCSSRGESRVNQQKSLYAAGKNCFTTPVVHVSYR